MLRSNFVKNSTRLMKNCKKYLFWFASDHADFRFSEMEAIASLHQTSIQWIEKPCGEPFWIVDLPSDEIARKIADRSVTLKCVAELWAMNSNISNFHSDVKQFANDFFQKNKELEKSSFKFNVEVFCNKQTYEEKMRKIESFSYLPLRGRVDLKNPGITFQYFEYYGIDPNNVPKTPQLLIFGRLISNSTRKVISDFSLKKRKFIGNTSMDPELSLLMANCALINEGDLVYDPFVGTGSLLIAAAHFGGYALGVDIDFLMIHGRTKPTRKQTRHIARKGENVLANFKQYGLENYYIDVMVGDSSLPLWKKEFVLDAIITDPPYGIREATERIGSNGYHRTKDSDAATRFPHKTEYRFHQIMYDLLHFSALHLKFGGRLVTWIPVFREDYDECRYIPKHSCFSLISNSEQILSKVVSRRLLTYEKIKEPTIDTSDLCEAADSCFREKYLNYKYSNKI